MIEACLSGFEGICVDEDEDEDEPLVLSSFKVKPRLKKVREALRKTGLVIENDTGWRMARAAHAIIATIKMSSWRSSWRMVHYFIAASCLLHCIDTLPE